MNTQTNNRLKALDRRITQTYRAAELTAIERLRRAEERLRDFKLNPNVPTAYHQQALHMHMLRVDRELGILQNIAADIARSGDIAGSMIRNESLSVYTSGYRSGVNEIKAQLGRIGIDVSWSDIDRRALQALYSGQDTQLARIVGYRGGFEQIGVRQDWVRNAIGDRRRGTYQFQRALTRLGDKATIVHRLQNQLAQALILGEAIPKIATRIRAITQGCRMQAVRIARTECLRALNQGKMISYYHAQDNGIEVRKEWISTFDDRTRDSHAHLMGEVRKLDESFSNGLMYPLDPGGPPEEVVNCRCIVVCVIVMSAMAA
jgi:SPP1 gp7 family putative phage head morphogenesis protein